MIDLRQGDCLEVMADLSPASVDLVLCDLPYGVTDCGWDEVIPLAPLWGHYRRLLKPNGAVVLTATQPFATDLIQSNRRWFRYDLVWDKAGRSSGFLNANRMPLRGHESVLVFYAALPTYNPQMRQGKPYKTVCRRRVGGLVYGDYTPATTVCESGLRHPTSVLTVASSKADRGSHSTQKPVALMEYLVRTYTDPGALVLDNAMGSGTTGVACVRSGRRFVGIEKDPDYFAAAARRIEAARGEAA